MCDIEGRLNEWIKLFKNTLKGHQTLFVIDDCSAEGEINKKRDALSELAFSSRNRNHSLWVLTQKYNSVSKDVRELFLSYKYNNGFRNTRSVEKSVDSEVTKPKRGRKKKTDTKMNELEENDVRDKRERLVACVLSGNSKTFLGKEYTEQQINEMDSYNINTLSNRYESILSAQMTKSLGKSVIDLYSNIACSVLGVGNLQDLSDDLEYDPFLNTAMQKFTCDLYYRFGALLAPVSVGIITGKHYAENSITKLNDRSNNGTCDPATRNCNKTEEPPEN